MTALPLRLSLDGIDGEKQPADSAYTGASGEMLSQPHLTIYLDAPAEVLFARKGEKTLEDWSAAVRLSFNLDTGRRTRPDRRYPPLRCCSRRSQRAD